MTSTWSDAAHESASWSRQRVVLLAIAMMLLSGGSHLARMTRDALFLTYYGANELTFMYSAGAAATIACAVAYWWLADRVRRDLLVVVTATAFGASFVLLTLLTPAAPRPVILINYVLVEAGATLGLIQFTTLLGDFVSAREAKRVFPLMAGAGVLGAVLVGILASILLKADVLSTSAMMIVAGTLFIIEGAVVAIIGWREAARTTRTAPALTHKRPLDVGARSALNTIVSNRHLRVIAGMTALMWMNISVVDFQFKSAVLARYSVSGAALTDDMNAFYAMFFSSVYVVSVLLQLFVTGRVLERIGVVPVLFALPVLALIGSVTMLSGLVAGTIAAVALKASEVAVRNGVHASTLEVLYTPVPGMLRGRAKALIDGVLQPLAAGAAGLLMWVLVTRVGVGAQVVSALSLVVAIAWIGLARLIRREFIGELLAHLRRRRLDFQGESSLAMLRESATVDALKIALRDPQPDTVRSALELTRHLPGDVVAAEVFLLLDHAEPDVRARACAELTRMKAPALEAELPNLLLDASEDVRAAAIRAVSELSGVDALPLLRRHLNGSPLERSAAVAALLRTVTLDGTEDALRALRDMLGSDDPRWRLGAAHALHDLGAPSMYREVFTLMRDPSQAVRNAAIEVAAVIRVAHLIPGLVYHLATPPTRRAAATALAAYGEPIIPTIVSVLRKESEDRGIRIQAGRILDRIGTSRSLEALLDGLAITDVRTRLEVAKFAARLRNRLGASIDGAKINHHIDLALTDHYQTVAMLVDLDDVFTHDKPDLLRDALTERLHRSRALLFWLLAIIYPSKALESIHGSLESDSSLMKANATEALENLLNRKHRDAVMPIVERLPLREMIARAPADLPLRRATAQDWLAELMISPDGWQRVATMTTIAELGLAHAAEVVTEQLAHHSAVVRETAIKTLARIVPPAKFIGAATPLVHDANEKVRRYTCESIAHALAALAPASSEGAQGADALSIEAGHRCVDSLVPPMRSAVVLGIACGQVSFLAAAGVSVLPSRLHELTMPLSAEGFLEVAARTRDVIVIDIEARDSTPADRLFFHFLGIARPRSLAVLPILLAGKLAGLLYVDRNDGNEATLLGLARSAVAIMAAVPPPL